MWQNIIEVLIGLVSGGAITTLLMFQLNKRGKAAEIKKQEIDVEKIQDEFYRESIKSAYRQLTEVQTILDKVREELRTTTERLAAAELRNVELEAELKKAKSKCCDNSLDCINRINCFSNNEQK